MNRTKIILLVSLFISVNAISNVYYVSNAGSDNNDGLSKDTPFKTLGFAAGKVSPGDVILLRRGDVFRESVEIKAKNIELNEYGLDGEWRDLRGESITGSITLEPYTSRILIK